MIYYKLLQITNIVKGSKQIVFYKVVSKFLGEIVNYCFCKNQVCLTNNQLKICSRKYVNCAADQLKVQDNKVYLPLMFYAYTQKENNFF